MLGNSMTMGYLSRVWIGCGREGVVLPLKLREWGRQAERGYLGLIRSVKMAREGWSRLCRAL